MEPSHLDELKRKNLIRLMDEKGLRPVDLARLAKWAPSQVSMYTGGTSNMGRVVIKKLCKALNVEESEFLDASVLVDDSEKVQHKRQYGPYPHISSAAAGEACEAIDNWQPGVSGEGDRRQSDVNAGPRSFWLTIDGDSMEPDLPEGFIALVDPDRPVRTGDPCVVRIGDNEVTMKFWYENGEVIKLIPNNIDGGHEVRIFDKISSKKRLCPIGRIVDVKIRAMPTLKNRNGS